MKKLVLIVIIVLEILVLCKRNFKPKLNVPPQLHQTFPEDAIFPKIKEEIVVPKKVEPEWMNYPKIHDTQFKITGTLKDIEEHTIRGTSPRFTHNFQDLITWGHETSHLISSKISLMPKHYGLYVLKDRAIQIPWVGNSALTAKVAKSIPEKLRGHSYNLYLIEQGAKSVSTLMLFDEWIAYTNGATIGKELNYKGWWYECLQAHQFNIYCIYVAKGIQEEYPEYDHTIMKTFMKWNIERTFGLLDDTKEVSNKLMPDNFPKCEICPNHLVFTKYDKQYGQDNGFDSNPLKASKDYEEVFRSASESEPLHTFMREYFGKEWCKEIYGF